jgi:hypothetical protein
MRKTSLFLFGLFLLVPSLSHAVNQTARDYDEQGLALYRQGLYDKSAVYFEKATQADPSDWQAYENLGNAYLKLKDDEAALSAYQNSLRINPDNITVENIVNDLKNSGTVAVEESPSSEDQASSVEPPPSDVENEQPIQNEQSQETVVVTHPQKARHRILREPAPHYSDGLNPIDHAKYWLKSEAGYTYSAQTDLIASAAAVNSESASGTLPFGFDSGNALMSTTGYNLGFELGLMINPYNGVAIGGRYIQGSNYDVNEANSAPSTISGEPSDFESATFSPYAVPISLDYYLFLPDADGRSYISAGVGYYISRTVVSEAFSISNYNQAAGYSNAPFGDLTSGAFGFQASIGREFAVTDRFSIDIFARGRYVKISNYTGVLSDGNTYGLLKFADGSVDIDNPALVGSGGVQYATLDFTGFDIGLAFCWYSF